MTAEDMSQDPCMDCGGPRQPYERSMTCEKCQSEGVAPRSETGEVMTPSRNVKMVQVNICTEERLWMEEETEISHMIPDMVMASLQSVGAIPSHKYVPVQINFVYGRESVVK